MWSWPAVRRKRLSGENAIEVIEDECLVLYLFRRTKGSKVR